MSKHFYIFNNNSLLIKSGSPDPVSFNLAEWQTMELDHEEPILFGNIETEQYYVTEVSNTSIKIPDYQWLNLRNLVGRLDDNSFTLCSRASQILNWKHSHRFCGRCGLPTSQHPTELARECISCSETFYPRISPCIIVLITHGNHILLARSERFKNNMYSTLAGFIEPGESAEDTLHREIYEEVAIRVKNVSYFGSQAWPFPGQLMLGFCAEYESGEIKADGNEIVDAQWFSTSSLPVIPGKSTIAGQLIRTYIATIENQ